MAIMTLQNDLQAGVVYVQRNASGQKNGTSWQNAFTDLQTGINACEASGGGEVWVAAGIYVPTSGQNSQGDPRSCHFTLKSNVGVYGGFFGVETSRDQRIIGQNRTILSGDILGNDSDADGDGYPDPATMSDNVYHVIFQSSAEVVDQTAILDGVEIIGGNATGLFPDNYGGGLYCDGSSLLIRKCRFSRNRSSDGGGAADGDNSTLSIEDCSFEWNVSKQGGAIYHYQAFGNYLRCSFYKNHAGSSGGAIFNDNSSLVTVRFTEIYANWNSATENGGFLACNDGIAGIEDSTFECNFAAADGGSVYIPLGTLGITNSTFYSNHAYRGGAVSVVSGSADVRYCTFNGDDAQIAAVLYNQSGLHNVRDSILWPASTANGIVVKNGADSPNDCTNVSYCVVRNGYYIDNPQKYPGVNDSSFHIVTGDPLFLPFLNYGGFAKTCPIGRGSGAIGAADRSVPDIANDQRGISRDIAPDAGACEYQTFPQSVHIMADSYSGGAGHRFILTAFSEGENLSYNWYEGQSGDKTRPAGHGNPFTTPAITNSLFYWVEVAASRKSVSSESIMLSIYPVFYVSCEGAEWKDGGSWSQAKRSLATALSLAGPTTEIWVAKGTYLPNDGQPWNNDRSQAFRLRDGVRVYGGFAGNETSRIQRNIAANETILSGDIGIPGSVSDNCYHVFYHPSGLVLGPDTQMDGFAIVNGNANGTSFPDDSGAAFFQDGSQIQLRNCNIHDNSTGDAVYLKLLDQVTMEDCQFKNNPRGVNLVSVQKTTLNRCGFTNNGGGRYNGAGLRAYGSPIVLNACTFSGNWVSTSGYMSKAYGGAILSQYSDIQIDQCYFVNNSVYAYAYDYYSNGSRYNYYTGEGGAIYTEGLEDRIALLSIKNSAFVSNSVPVGGGSGSVIANALVSVTMVNTLVASNSSSKTDWGYTLSGAAVVAHCTFYGNSGQRLFYGSHSQIIDSILWNPGIVEIPALSDGEEATNVSYSIIRGGYAGVQNQSGDPMLCPIGEYGGPTPSMPPGEGSPAINAGLALYPSGLAVTNDQRGFSRDSHPDLGACEAQNAPVIRNGPPPSALLGVSYSFSYQTHGSPTPMFTVTSGKLPPGLMLSAGGLLSGTPTELGSYTGIVKAANGLSPDAIQSFSITVGFVPISIDNSPPPANATAGSAYSFRYHATGYPTPTFTVDSGSLPPGLALSTNGLLSGTPSQTGSFNGVVKAANGISPDAAQQFSITVSRKPPATTNWQVSPSTIEMAMFSGIDYANGNFAQVGYSDVLPGSAILTSTNGSAWITRQPGSFVQISAIAYGHATFVAVGVSGTILTSPDLVTWSSKNVGYNDFSAITCANGIFVVVGMSGTILTSSDAVNWTNQLSGTTCLLTSITYGNGIFVAVGQSGTILTSPDAVNWTSRISGTTSGLQGIAFGDGLFVAVGNEILASPDAVNWTNRASGISGYLGDVTYGGSTFVAVGGANAGGSLIMSSADSVNWDSLNLETFGGMTGVAFGNNTFVAVGLMGTIITRNLASAVNDPATLGFGRSNGALRLNLAGSVGSMYVLQATSNLVSWSSISTNTIPDSGMITILDLGSTNKSRMFYRAISK